MDRSVIIGFLLAIFGGVSALMLYSISTHEAVGQLMFAGIGLCTYIGIQMVPRRLLKISAPALYLLTVLLLFLTLFLGHSAKGAQRWFSLGPVRIQVSELAKPLFALALTSFVLRFPLNTQRRILAYMVLSLPVVLSVLLQPDLGSSLVLSVIAGSIALFSVRRMSMLIPWVFLAVVGVIFAWQFVLYPYQKDRIFSFLGRSDSAASYNAKQAIITVGSGKLWGRGIGHGVQTNLRFLPEHHTDFFFASFAEETGLVGVMTLIFLYGLLFFFLINQILFLEPFDRIFRFALFSGLLFQMGVHLAMNIGLSPVTGIPLPFLSSGGSSFVSLALFLGMGMRFRANRQDLAR